MCINKAIIHISQWTRKGEIEKNGTTMENGRKRGQAGKRGQAKLLHFIAGHCGPRDNIIKLSRQRA